MESGVEWQRSGIVYVGFRRCAPVNVVGVDGDDDVDGACAHACVCRRRVLQLDGDRALAGCPKPAAQALSSRKPLPIIHSLECVFGADTTIPRDTTL